MKVPRRIEMRAVVSGERDLLNRPALPVREIFRLQPLEELQHARQALLVVDILDRGGDFPADRPARRFAAARKYRSVVWPFMFPLVSGLSKVVGDRTAYSGLMPASWITFAPLRYVSLDLRGDSSGELTTGSNPSAAKRSLHLGLRNHLVKCAVQKIHDLLWRADRHEDALPSVSLLVGKSDLRHRRHLRQCRRAFGTRHCKALSVPAFACWTAVVKA